MRGAIKLLNGSTKTVTRVFRGHGNSVNELLFHPVDCNLLFSASRDESIRLWNIVTGSCVLIMAGDQGHRDEVLSMVWLSPHVLLHYRLTPERGFAFLLGCAPPGQLHCYKWYGQHY